MSRSNTPDLESLLHNLATVKIQHAETLHSLELKSLELKEALQREKNVREQLEQARAQVDILTKVGRHMYVCIYIYSLCTALTIRILCFKFLTKVN